jgi:hypothetical protein
VFYRVIAEKIPGWMNKKKRNSLSSVESSLLAKTDQVNDNSQISFEYTFVFIYAFHVIHLLCSFRSGSGSGGVTLNQRTIALDLTLLDTVARGRYGEVRKAMYRGSMVAVKVTFYFISSTNGFVV